MEFKLRPWNINDLDSLVEYANNPKIAMFMTDGFPYPYTKEHGIKFIEFATKDDPIHIFAIEINGKASGGIGIHPQSDIMNTNAELGYWLAEPFWGQGIITKAIKEISEFAFKTYDITRIFARPFSTNLASQKVLEKAGYNLEARIEKSIIKNGEFLDELIYAKRRLETKQMNNNLDSINIPNDGRPIFEGEIATYWFEDGILISLSKNILRTVENISGNVKLVKEITGNKIVPLLIYLSDSPVPDKATRQFSREQLPNIYSAMAMVSKPGLSLLIMNLLFRFNTPPIPIKSFTNEGEAKKWLSSFI